MAVVRGGRSRVCNCISMLGCFGRVKFKALQCLLVGVGL